MTHAPCCDNLYGGGETKDLVYFRGPRYNLLRGHGFFSTAFKRLMPILRHKILPYLGKRLLETGENVLHNLNEGDQFKEAVKKSAKETLKRAKDDLVHELSGSGGRYKRPRSVKRCHKPRRRVRGDYLDA
jgi:hypothetical protein